MSARRYQFQADPGMRVLRRGFVGIEVGRVTIGAADEPTMWWDCDNRRWIADRDFPWGKGNPERTFHASNLAPCRSFAAFRRHLRKHRRELSGRRVRLVSRYHGCDVYAMPAEGGES